MDSPDGCCHCFVCLGFVVVLICLIGWVFFFFFFLERGEMRRREGKNRQTDMAILTSFFYKSFALACNRNA
jgi:hypothetical protein